MLVDSHCHLTHPRFAADLPEVLDRATAAGISRLLTIGTGCADARAARALAGRHPDRIACSAGLDPFSCHQAGEDFPTALAELTALLEEGGFCALGEVGLEYHHPVAAKPDQRQQLEAQLDLARRLQLPVILHVREAHADMLAILADWRGLAGVVHSFSGGPSEARAYLDLGWHLAFNGSVTYKGNDGVREAALLVPEERLLIETDAPYLAPVPLRGRRCEPGHAAVTATFLADLRGVAGEALMIQAGANARRLFGWG